MPLPAVATGVDNATVMCAKCDEPAKRTYNCDHTNYEEYCKECYTELHYYLTEPAGGTQIQDAPRD